MRQNCLLTSSPSSIFCAAGAETTSSLLASLLVRLGQRQDYQLRLQRELDEFYSSLNEEEPDWDSINSLPFLSSLISEVLRMNPPVPLTSRCSITDDVIPLSRPVMDRNGNKISQIKVPRNSYILLGLGSVNRLKEIWGEVNATCSTMLEV